MDKCSVLIVGAGPVGLTMAAYLSHFGIKPRIIDKNEHATTTSNAVGVHARTLELLNIIDLADKFSNAGRLIKSVKFVTPQKQMAEFDFSKLESSYPYICDLPQSQTEALLLEYLAEHNIAVERQTTLVDFENTNSGVTVKLQRNDQLSSLHCDWLIACDGYRSLIREKLNIPYEGGDLSFHCLMIDAPIEWNYPQDSMYISFTKDLSLAMFPMKKSVRMIAEVSRCDEYKNVKNPDENTFAKIVPQCVPGKMTIHKPLWNSNFWIHERLARHYNQGNVFLVGDAAHVHSPAGGQGMNTGMQDAINLSWKLAWAIKNKANKNLLTSYETERRPVAEGVIKLSGVQTKIAFTRNPILSSLRNFLLPHVTRLKAVQQKMISTLSEIAIHYRNSPLVAGTPQNHYAPGDRLPLLPDKNLGLRYLLLDFSGDSDSIATHYSDKLVIKKMAGNNSFSITRGYCLVRPDFYIGYLGHDKQALANYLKDNF